MITGTVMGQAIRRIREEKGLSQGDVVRRIRKGGKEVERNFLSGIETGKVKYPRVETISLITKALDVRFCGFVFYCEIEMKKPIEVICKKFEESIEELMDGVGVVGR